jgi:hypothetical protein
MGAKVGMDGLEQSVPIMWGAREMKGEERGGGTEAEEVSCGKLSEEGGVGGVSECNPTKGEEQGGGPRGGMGWG